MKSQLPAMTKTILMVLRMLCFANQESAVASRSLLPLRPVRMEIEHLGLTQRCKTASVGQDYYRHQYTKRSSPKDIHIA
jgi:hypothetical protein